MSGTKPAPESASARTGRGRHWLWSVMIGAAILLCGMVIGACLALVVVRNRVIDLIQHPEKRTGAMVRRLDRALDLSEDQRADVRRVLRKHRAEFNEIRRDVAPRVQREIDAMDRDLSKILTPEQKAKWDRYLKRLLRLWMPRLRRDGGEGRGGRDSPEGEPPK